MDISTASLAATGVQTVYVGLSVQRWLTWRGSRFPTLWGCSCSEAAVQHTGSRAIWLVFSWVLPSQIYYRGHGLLCKEWVSYVA